MPLQSHPPTTVEKGFSFDEHLSALGGEDVLIIRITNEDHPRLSQGDILIIDRNQECADKDLLLIDYGGQYILRQKKFVNAILRRAEIREVQSDAAPSVRIVGKVIGWAAGR